MSVGYLGRLFRGTPKADLPSPISSILSRRRLRRKRKTSYTLSLFVKVNDFTLLKWRDTINHRFWKRLVKLLIVSFFSLL